eukprot:462198_1
MGFEERISLKAAKMHPKNINKATDFVRKHVRDLKNISQQQDVKFNNDEKTSTNSQQPTEYFEKFAVDKMSSIYQHDNNKTITNDTGVNMTAYGNKIILCNHKHDVHKWTLRVNKFNSMILIGIDDAKMQHFSDAYALKSSTTNYAYASHISGFTAVYSSNICLSENMTKLKVGDILVVIFDILEKTLKFILNDNKCYSVKNVKTDNNQNYRLAVYVQKSSVTITDYHKHSKQSLPSKNNSINIANDAKSLDELFVEPAIDDKASLVYRANNNKTMINETEINITAYGSNVISCNNNDTIYKWSLRINKFDSMIFIGIDDAKQANLTDAYALNPVTINYAYASHVSGFTAIYSSNSNLADNITPFKVGDNVSVILDVLQRTLRFELNGNHKYTVRNVNTDKNRQYRLAVYLQQSSVTINDCNIRKSNDCNDDVLKIYEQLNNTDNNSNSSQVTSTEEKSDASICKNDITKCKQLEFLSSIMHKYQESNNCINNYNDRDNIVKILNSFNHLLFDHSANNDEFDNIFKLFGG